jgi:hypothetical protein
MDELTDAIIEDTVHCTVCGASWVLGDPDCYVILDPPGDPTEAYEHGCEQVKLCATCAMEVARQVTESEINRLEDVYRRITEIRDEGST